MDRRAFLVASACAALVGCDRAAEQASAVRRIGFLAPGKPFPAEDIEGDAAALRRSGWIEGRNLRVDRRYPRNADELRSDAEALVRLKVDLIVTEGTNATLAAKAATSTIPIVIRSSGDPVRVGIVASLSRPGGNVTGFSIVGPEQNEKRLALLRELLPEARRVGQLEDPTNVYARAMRADLERAYEQAGLQPVFASVTRPDELVPAIARLARERVQAICVENSELFEDNAAVIMDAALRYHLPTIVEGIVPLEAGGLLTHHIDFAERNDRVAAIIDKILRGEKPADIPIEQPTRFELVINLKTANALGIVVPPSLLARADRVVR